MRMESSVRLMYVVELICSPNELSRYQKDPILLFNRHYYICTQTALTIHRGTNYLALHYSFNGIVILYTYLRILRVFVL